MTSFSTMTSRVILSTKAGALPRAIVSETALPFGPRTLATAASTVRPSTGTASMLVMRSPARRPALSAGEPAIGSMIVRPHVGPRVAQSAFLPSVDLPPTLAPIPSNWPDRPCRLFAKSSGVMYPEYGSPRASIMPLMAPSMTALRSTSPPA